MIVEGVVLGGITLAGFYFTYQKLPGKVKKFLLNHPVATELMMMVAFYEVMGMTIVAHVACATMVLGSMAGLHMARNPEDYQFVSDAIGEAKTKIRGALERLRELNRKHVEEKKAKLSLVA